MKEIKNKNIIIYGFGITGKWLSSQLDTKMIVDTDLKKWGESFAGADVVSPDALRTLNKESDVVIVTVVDIFDVIPLLNFYGVHWISLVEVLADNYSIASNITGESDEFLKYSIDTVLQCQQASLNTDDFYLRSVDLVITEKCTLKCKDCANLMQFYERPVNYSVVDILSGIRHLSSKANFIHEVRVIGGEPFLNKDIYEIVNEISLIDNINRIVIYTNGMIPPKDDQVASFNPSKVVFSITDYGDLARNLDKTVAVLDKYSLPYRVHPPEHWTDSGRILSTPLVVEEAKDLFAKCCGKNLYTVVGELLYRCPFAANADQLSGIPSHPNNSISVLAAESEIKNYAYGVEYIDACRYCPGRSFDSPLIQPAIQVKQPIPFKKFIKINHESKLN